MHKKQLSYEVKEKIVILAGKCFWYWNSFYSFLDSCGVPKTLQKKYPQSVYKKYDAMRGILEDLNQNNNYEIIQSIVSNFYRLKNIIDKDNLDITKAQLLLKEFRELVGTDPIDHEIKKREIQENKLQHQKKAEKLKEANANISSLKSRFYKLMSDKDKTPNQRGFDMEILFFDILDLEEFEITRPYKHPGEQIDGHFKFENFDYLVEIKWINSPAKQEHISIFDGKIRSKAQSTRGLFLAINCFDNNAIQTFSGNSPRIVFMDGQDIINILEGSTTFYDCMKAKIDALVRFGNIYYKNYL